MRVNYYNIAEGLDCGLCKWNITLAIVNTATVFMLSYLILNKSFYTVYCTVETKNPAIIKKKLKGAIFKILLIRLEGKKTNKFVYRMYRTCDI